MNDAHCPLDLLPELSGPLAPIRDRLSFGLEMRRVVPATHVLDPDVFAGILDTYASRFGVEADRHLVSLWSQKYLATLIIPTMALSIIGGRAVNAAIEDTTIVVDEDCEPVALRLPSSFSAEGADKTASLLVSTHLTPLIDALARWSSLSKRIYWGNAAHYLEWIVRQLTRENAHVTLPSPMTDAIRYVEEEGVRVRRRKVCCLRDRIPSIEDCGSLCPDRGKRMKS